MAPLLEQLKFARDRSPSNWNSSNKQSNKTTNSIHDREQLKTTITNKQLYNIKVTNNKQIGHTIDLDGQNKAGMYQFS
jgi:hypothetical protein